MSLNRCQRRKRKKKSAFLCAYFVLTTDVCVPCRKLPSYASMYRCMPLTHVFNCLLQAFNQLLKKSLLTIVIGGNVEFCFDIVHSVRETSFNHGRHTVILSLFASIKVRFVMYPSNIEITERFKFRMQFNDEVTTLFSSTDANLPVSINNQV